MTVAIDWITCPLGGLSFLALDGMPQGIIEHTTQIVRPSVDGSATWLGGVWGDKFTLRSKVDCCHMAHASVLYLLYRTFIGEYVDLIWRGLPMTDANTKVMIDDMRRAKMHPCIYGVGGLSPPSQAWLECDWTMHAVYVAPEE